MDGGEANRARCGGGILKGIPFLRRCRGSNRITRINDIEVPARYLFLRVRRALEGSGASLRIKGLSAGLVVAKVGEAAALPFDTKRGHQPRLLKQRHRWQGAPDGGEPRPKARTTVNIVNKTQSGDPVDGVIVKVATDKFLQPERTAQR